MTKLTPPCYMEEIGWSLAPPRPQATPLSRVPREPPTAGEGDVGTRDGGGSNSELPQAGFPESGEVFCQVSSSIMSPFITPSSK